MIEHHFYSADAWSKIEMHIPRTDPASLATVRQRLERAAAAYFSDKSIKTGMTNAKAKRDRWRRVMSVANELREAIGSLDEWSPPVWGIVEPADIEQGTRDRDEWLKELETLSYMALENSWTCDKFVKGTSDEARLSSEILRVWTEDLHQQLGITRRENKVRGPLWNYFHAVALPVLGDKTPKPETFAKIVQREKALRRQPVRSGDGKAKSKKRLTLPSPMVP
jgi:hypothetical protein